MAFPWFRVRHVLLGISIERWMGGGRSLMGRGKSYIVPDAGLCRRGKVVVHLAHVGNIPKLLSQSLTKIPKRDGKAPLHRLPVLGFAEPIEYGAVRKIARTLPQIPLPASVKASRRYNDGRHYSRPGTAEDPRSAQRIRTDGCAQEEGQ